MTTRPLPRSTPSAEGVDAAGVASFVAALESASGVEMHSLMLVRHGRVVAEGWWSPFSADRIHLLYSLSKSFTSTALAMAVAEGRLRLDDPVVSFFPEFADEVTDPRSRAMRVRDCAAMASGHTTETLETAVRRDPHELVRGFLLTPPDADPGTLFAYNQPCTYTLSAILQRVTGERLVDYLRPRLFDPLGIEQAPWQQHPPGRDLGFSGLHASTESVARLGQLYLQRGRWDDVELVSPAWVAQATAAQISTAGEPSPDWAQGYGFQFWIARHGYRGDGAYGQFMVVLPEHDVVLATTGASEDLQAVLDAAWTHLLPALAGPGDPEADRGLADMLRTRRILPGAAAGRPPGAHPEVTGDWDGRVVVADARVRERFARLESVRVTRAGDRWALVLGDGFEQVTAWFAPGEWVLTEADEASVVPVAACGGWTDGVLEVEVAFVETPHRMVLTIGPEPDRLGARWHTEPLRARRLAQLGAHR